jgi:hypothetical protein
MPKPAAPDHGQVPTHIRPLWHPSAAPDRGQIAARVGQDTPVRLSGAPIHGQIPTRVARDRPGGPCGGVPDLRARSAERRAAASSGLRLSSLILAPRGLASDANAAHVQVGDPPGRLADAVLDRVTSADQAARWRRAPEPPRSHGGVVCSRTNARTAAHASAEAAANASCFRSKKECGAPGTEMISWSTPPAPGPHGTWPPCQARCPGRRRRRSRGPAHAWTQPRGRGRACRCATGRPAIRRSRSRRPGRAQAPRRTAPGHGRPGGRSCRRRWMPRHARSTPRSASRRTSPAPRMSRRPRHPRSERLADGCHGRHHMPSSSS